MAWALQFLIRYSAEGNEFLERIVTSGEMWILLDTQNETKCKVWKMAKEETLQKFKKVPSMGKVTFTIFWDHKGPYLLGIYW